MLMPGEHSSVDLTLLRKMAVELGQPFTIRENNVNVATGIITDRLEDVILIKGNLDKINL